MTDVFDRIAARATGSGSATGPGPSLTMRRPARFEPRSAIEEGRSPWGTSTVTDFQAEVPSPVTPRGADVQEARLPAIDALPHGAHPRSEDPETEESTRRADLLGVVTRGRPASTEGVATAPHVDRPGAGPAASDPASRRVA